MHTRKFSQRLGLLLLAVVLAVTVALTLPVLAQDALLEFVGELQGQTATTITVNNVTIDIQNADVRGPLALGALVHVEAALVNGQFVARQVVAGGDDLRPNEIELVGVVQAIDANTLLVGGQVINLVGAQVAPGLDAGSVVRASVTSTENGWVARNVRPHSALGSDDSVGIVRGFGDNEDFGLVGTLQGVGDGVVVVSGQQFDVSQANVRGLLALGALVQLNFDQVNGQWVVTDVRGAGQTDLFGNDDSSGLFGNNDNSGGLLGNNDNSRGLLGNNDNASASFFFGNRDNSSGLFGNNDNRSASLFGNNDDSSGSRFNLRSNLTCGQIPNGWTTYAIVGGDTLSGIAARSGANLGDLIAVNCITNPNNVPVGTILAVPRTPAPRPQFPGGDNNSASNNFGNFDNFDNTSGGDNRSRNNDDSSGSRGGRRGGDSGGDNRSWSGTDDHSGSSGDQSSRSGR